MFEFKTRDGSTVPTLTHPAGEFRAAFDLTAFGDAQTWLDGLDRFDLEEETPGDPVVYDGDMECFVWHNDQFVVRTYANPRTGIRANMPDRDPEPGYASYIHVIGQEEDVAAFYQWVKDNAAHIKEASLGKWCV